MDIGLDARMQSMNGGGNKYPCGTEGSFPDIQCYEDPLPPFIALLIGTAYISLYNPYDTK